MEETQKEKGKEGKAIRKNSKSKGSKQKDKKRKRI